MAGLTQEAFAEMVGLDVKHISAMEREAVGVPFNTIQTICRVLAISSNALLSEDSGKNNVAARQRDLSGFLLSSTKSQKMF